MTHSLQSLLGSDPQIRTFFSLPPIWEDESLRANDARQVEGGGAEEKGFAWLVLLCGFTVSGTVAPTGPTAEHYPGTEPTTSAPNADTARLRTREWTGRTTRTIGFWSRPRTISSSDGSGIVLGSSWMAPPGSQMKERERERGEREGRER